MTDSPKKTHPFIERAIVFREIRLGEAFGFSSRRFANAMPSANATNLLTNLRKANQPLENISPDDTPTEEILAGLRQGLQEALTGQTILLSQMWDGIDAD